MDIELLVFSVMRAEPDCPLNTPRLMPAEHQSCARIYPSPLDTAKIGFEGYDMQV